MAEYNKDTTILAIESSCDDTSAAVLRNTEVLSNIIATQKVHENYGGVVPELASRAHQQNIIPVVESAIKEAGITKDDLSAIAFTRGPGLLGSLLVGVSFAKSMSQAMEIPLIEVNHMQAHVLAHFITGADNLQTPEFPFLCLTVSGGHTQIVLVRDHLDMEVIGRTIDDAAGEAFDKTAKLIGLPYPGGPLVDKHGSKGNPNAFEFTTPSVAGYDFSFSGIKTSVLYFIQKQVKHNPNFVEAHLNDICASVQHTIVSYLLKQLSMAAEKLGIKHIAIAGGVSANSYLRKSLLELSSQKQWTVFIPPFQYCTDNAAMIGITGYYKYLNKDFCELDVAALARMPI